MNLNVHPLQKVFHLGCAATHKLPKRKQKSKHLGMNDRRTMFPCGCMVGHGLDVVDVADFSRLLSVPACGFLDRYFTDSELSAAGEGINKTERLAGRFALKEAVLKALGVGWGDGISFTDIEIITQCSGAPTVVLYRRLAELQREREITGWLVSASHTNTVAVGSVIALGAWPTCRPSMRQNLHKGIA